MSLGPEVRNMARKGAERSPVCQGSAGGGGWGCGGRQEVGGGRHSL